MTRCTYFLIENSEPVPGWTLHTADIDISFFMMELSGVITSPPGEGQYFDSLSKIDNLFEVIERNHELCVEVNDIWLPNVLFENTGVKSTRGQVYRIGHDLFKTAYKLNYCNRHEASAPPKIVIIGCAINILSQNKNYKHFSSLVFTLTPKIGSCCDYHGHYSGTSITRGCNGAIQKKRLVCYCCFHDCAGDYFISDRCDPDISTGHYPPCKKTCYGHAYAYRK